MPRYSSTLDQHRALIEPAPIRKRVVAVVLIIAAVAAIIALLAVSTVPSGGHKIAPRYHKVHRVA